MTKSPDVNFTSQYHITIVTDNAVYVHSNLYQPKTAAEAVSIQVVVIQI